jgi:hypothetical protein
VDANLPARGAAVIPASLMGHAAEVVKSHGGEADGEEHGLERGVTGNLRRERLQALKDERTTRLDLAHHVRQSHGDPAVASPTVTVNEYDRALCNPGRVTQVRSHW